MFNNDKRIHDNVQYELQWQPNVEAEHIGVSAENGAVTLTGHVPTYLAKMQAVKAAERVRGVRAVADELDVKLGSAHAQDDTTLAGAIAQNFKWNLTVPMTVQARVATGWVTLTGEADTVYERNAAAHAVRYQRGVVGVTNEIVVKEHPSKLDVELLINSAFQRHALLDARDIDVTVKNHTVRLDGKVHSVGELRAARAAATAAPGVTSVDSNLTVTI